jgi:uncharacterized protein (DUF2141 family)
MSQNHRRAITGLARMSLLIFFAFGTPILHQEVRAQPSMAMPLEGKGGRIAVTFNGLQGNDGYLRVSLCNRAEGFPNGPIIAHRDLLLPTLDPKTFPVSVSVTFDGLPPGVYAVCAFHDHDGSGKLTQNLLGIPQEEWGVSGNRSPRFRAPRFEEAHLDIAAQETKFVRITLHK